MKTIRFLLLCLVTFSITGTIEAQYVDSGQDPAKINWKQINTEHFQLIFPEEITSEALKLAKALEIVYSEGGKTLNHQPKKISVILHSFTSVSNAAVYWAPRRTEFNTIPPQDIYPQYWLDQLAIHEFRHVVQLDKMRQGLTEIIYILFGEQGTALITGLHVPLWFLEGDAVVTETALSCSGRGKLPEFGMPMRALLLEKKIFTYEKAYFRSFRHFIPNHYVLGYYLVSEGRERYGHSLWSEALNSAARKPFLPFTYFSPLRKRSGRGRYKLYNTAMQDLQTTWRAELDSLEIKEGKRINREGKRVFTNYRFPQALQDGTVLARKTGLGDIEQFVILGIAGVEQTVYVPGFSNMKMLSSRQGKLVWEQYTFDPRWSNRIFSDIHLLDVSSRKHRKLTEKRYLFSPALSPDGKKIVAVEALPDNTFSFVFLDSETGREYGRIRHPDNLFPTTPSWSGDGEKVAAILLENEGKTIQILNYEEGNFRKILPATCLDINQPVFWKDFLVFHGTFEGKDDIYSVSLQDGQIFKITETRFGGFDPNINGDSLMYSSYTSDGFNVRTMKLTPSEWKEVTEVVYPSPRYAFMEAEENILAFDYDSVPDLPVEDFKRWKDLINVHSWFPAALNIETIGPAPGITFLSQNKLSTSFLTAGYRYNINERVPGYSVNYTYKGWYPVWSVDFYSRLRAFQTTDTLHTWREDAAGGTVYVPLNLTQGKYSAGARPAVSYQYIFRSSETIAPEDLVPGPFNLFSLEMVLFRYLRTAPRDIIPRMGQDLVLSFRHSPFGNELLRSSFYGNASVYLPSLFKHHSLYLNGGYETFSGSGYRLPHLAAYPRGYFLQAEDELVSGSAEYWFPIAYPDLTVRGLLYVKRLRGTAFADYAEGHTENVTTRYSSVGMDLIADVHLLNFFTPFNVGVRFIHLPQERVNFIQLLLDIEIPGA